MKLRQILKLTFGNVIVETRVPFYYCFKGEIDPSEDACDDFELCEGGEEEIGTCSQCLRMEEAQEPISLYQGSADGCPMRLLDYSIVTIDTEAKTKRDVYLKIHVRR